MSVREGDVLGGRYRVTRRIGSGGMGAVYEAVQEGLGRTVAVKILLPQASVGAHEALERFKREARAAAALGHPNIAQVSDFGANPGEPAFLVMELVSGKSLRDLVNAGGPLPEARAANILVQVLSALGAAHAAGIIHRDVKPANVMITQTTAAADIVKMLDFGIAKLVEDTTQAPLTKDGVVMGTAAYMPPEQALAQDIDHRVDLYAAGVTLFFALTARRPFEAATLPEMLKKLEHTNAPLVHELARAVDPALSAVVARALAKRREDRYASAEEMIEALRPFTRAHAGPATLPDPPAKDAVASSTMRDTAPIEVTNVPSTPKVEERPRPTAAADERVPPTLADGRAPANRRVPLVMALVVALVMVCAVVLLLAHRR